MSNQLKFLFENLNKFLNYVLKTNEYINLKKIFIQHITILKCETTDSIKQTFL